MQNPLKIYAKNYHKLGFNVTCITNYLTEFNFGAKNLSKVPYHEWEKFEYSRQTVDELMEYDWDNATGVGVVLGFENLCAIDIDGCVDDSFLHEVLRVLKLPRDYEWVTKTGSNRGYHILFYGANHEKDVLIKHIIKEIGGKYANLKPFDGLKPCGIKESGTRIQAFLSKKELRPVFEKMEFMPEKQLIMPPSLHKSTFSYRFLNNVVPKSKPFIIESNDLLNELADKFIDLKEGFVNDCGSANAMFFNYTTTIDHDFTKHWLTVNGKIRLVLSIVTDGLPQKNVSEEGIVSINWPRIIQIAWLLIGRDGHMYKKNSDVVLGRDQNVDYVNIDFSAIDKVGVDLRTILHNLIQDLEVSAFIVCHNAEFVMNVLSEEMKRLGIEYPLESKHVQCTLKESTKFFKLKNKHRQDYPGTLKELYKELYGEEITFLHNAETDLLATTRCFWKLKELKIMYQ